MPQTTVVNPQVGSPGLRTSRNPSDKTESYLNAGSAAIKLGYGVVVDTSNGEDCCEVPAASTGKFAGVTWNDQSLTAEAQSTGYAQNKPVPVIQRGTVDVVVEEDVVIGDPVYLRYTADSAKLPGMFGKTSDSGKNVLLTGVAWKNGGTAADGYANLELNLP